MKISMIGPVFPYRGGIAHFTTLLAKKLSEAGHQVQVISFKKQYPAWLYPGKSDKDYSPGREKVPADFILTPLNPISWAKTAHAIVEFEPDQVVLPWWVTVWGPPFRNIITRLKRKGFPITILIHNTLPHEARTVDRWLARRTLQSADRYIVMTEKEKQRLLDLVPTAEDIKVVSHPIYPSVNSAPNSKEEAKKSLGLPIDQPVLLFFGFVRPYKGLSDLLKSLKIIISKNQKVHLVVAGEFWHGRTSYDQQIKALDLENYVHIYDQYIPDDEVAQFFKASDLFVAPYTDGTQSGALKTALGYGLPAVITNVIADEETARFLDYCKVVSSSEPKIFSKAIEEQLQQSRLPSMEIQKMITFSWSKMVDAICK